MKMKYLNKIIFINSANIPYAEISVDGNVHFTGTAVCLGVAFFWFILLEAVQDS